MSPSSERRNSNLSWFADHPRFVARSRRDTTIDAVGYDARHGYVEQFWLPVLGPSAVLALRRLADWLDGHPVGVEVELVEFGSSLGIGTGTGRHTQVNRTLGRLIDFGIARIDHDHLEVHTTLPPLPHRLRHRLPLSVLDALAEHERQGACSA